MSNEEKNLQDAKLSVKSHIKFFEALLTHLKGSDPVLKGRAMWAAWCLHRYINDNLISDIEQAMKTYGNTEV